MCLNLKEAISNTKINPIAFLRLLQIGKLATRYRINRHHVPKPIIIDKRQPYKKEQTKNRHVIITFRP